MISSKNILFICIGNTCRSPMAEAIANTLGNSNNHIKSCGINVTADNLNEKTIQVVRENLNIDLKDKSTTDIKNLELNTFDIIYSLDNKVTQFLISNYNLQNKTKNLFIADPFGNDMDVYRKTYLEIKEKLIEQLKDSL